MSTVTDENMATQKLFVNKLTSTDDLIEKKDARVEAHININEQI